MINVSQDEIKFVQENAPADATCESIELIYSLLRAERGPTPPVYYDENNKAVMARFYPLEWLDVVRFSGLSQKQVQAAYDLSMLGTSNESLERKLFSKATGIGTASIREIRGFKTPLRALMLCLWRHNYLLLPISFKLNGIASMVPRLSEHMGNFFTEIAKRGKSDHLKKFTTCTQHTVNWHTIEQVDYLEVWAVIPEISERRKSASPKGYKSNQFRRYCILSWLDEFSIKHPEIVSFEQMELILAYANSVGLQKVKTTQTPEEFKDYYYKSKQEKRAIINRAHKNLEQEKNYRPTGVDPRTPESYFATLRIQNRDGFKWLKEDGYPQLNLEQTKILSDGWVPFLEAYELDLIEKKRSKSHRKALLGPLYKLCDYLFGLLPKWREANPDTSVPVPLRVDDFSPAFFWKRMVDENSPYLQSFGPLPTTALDAYDLRSGRATSHSFVNGLHAFFDFCIVNRVRLHQNGLELLDADFSNPILLSDGKGSGPRPAGSDKLILPAFSVGIIRHYVIALNELGCQIREMCLARSIPSEIIRKMSISEWIDLEEIGISYELETNSPSETGGKIRIPLTQIPNCYIWHWENYYTSTKRDRQIYTGVPWLSALRMVAVGLFAGQRLQGAQWLGLDNYRSHHHEGASYWTSLFLLTDKTNPYRTCRLQRHVLKWLDDEAYFQTSTCENPPGLCFYENDEHTEYEKQRWLFRSPRSKTSAPCRDGVYQGKWVRILRGVEHIWNSIAPEELKYNFTTPVEHSHHSTRSGTIRYITAHTAHSLRNTYIAWMLERGDAEDYEVMKQVGHKSLAQTYHYASAQRPGTDYSMELADQRVELFDKELLASLFEGKPVKASAPKSTIRDSLSQNRDEAVKAQRMMSLSDGLIPAKHTGYDLIKVVQIDDLGVFDTCICVFNGRCTAEVLRVTKGPRRCGMCPFAVYALDHLEAINARMRQLRRNSISLENKIKQLEDSGESEIMLQSFREDKSLSAIEYSGYEQVTIILNAALADAKQNPKQYLIRDPDILTKHPISFKAQDPIQKILGELLDASHFPAFSNENYMAILKRAARVLHLKGFADTGDTEIVSPKAYLGQIAAQIRLLGWTFGDLSSKLRKHFPESWAGIEHAK